MANLETGDVEFVCGGKTYTLTLKTAGLSAIQKRFSKPGQIKKLEDTLLELNAGLEAESIDHIVVLIWASLQKYHPGTTYEQTIDLIDEAGGFAGLEQQLKALGLSMTPDPADLAELQRGAKKNPQQAQAKRRKRGNGATSTSTHDASV